MKIRITLTEEVLGSSPSNEELLASYIASKAPTDDLTEQEVDNIKAQAAEERMTIFPKTADGTPFIYDYQIKGLFKDSCKALATAGKAGYPGGKHCAALKAYKKAMRVSPAMRTTPSLKALADISARPHFFAARIKFSAYGAVAFMAI